MSVNMHTNNHVSGNNPFIETNALRSLNNETLALGHLNLVLEILVLYYNYRNTTAQKEERKKN